MKNKYYYFNSVSVLISIILILIICLENDLTTGFSNIEYCTNNRHIIGKWVNPKSRPSKSFVCCGWYAAIDYQWNTSVCGNTSYENNELYKFYHGGIPSMATQVGASACSCDSKSNRLELGSIEQYQWKPSFCDLPAWDANAFCHLLGNRTVLLVGDSTMMQVASTLMSMISYQQGACSHQVAYYRNDFLFHRHRDANSITGLAFNEIVLKVKPDICIFATGAHYRSIADMNNMWNHIELQIKEIRENIPNIKLYWKTQSPGHLNCIDEQRPLDSYEATNIKTTEDRFNWYLFPYFDNLSIEKSKINNIEVIDMTPLYYRIDSHAIGDCLHYCIPGPLNLFSILLLNILIKI